MKNSNGFTLIELLAVITILAIVMIIGVPSIINALTTSKNALSSIQKKNLEDSAERVVLEVINCDFSDKTKNVLNKEGQNITCSAFQNYVYSASGVSTTVEKLVQNGYFSDDANRCSGVIKINTNRNTYKVTVDTTNVTCK